MDTFRIRNADIHDMGQILSLEKATMARWKIEFFLEELALTNSAFFVAAEENTIIGFIVARKASDQVELFKIAVKEEYRRAGIGKALMESVMQHFSAKEVLLEVGEQNRGARAFYESLGFHEIGKRNNYYNGDNAILMAWNYEDYIS